MSDPGVEFIMGKNDERAMKARTHRRHPLHSPACVSMHPLPALSTVLVGVLRDVPCLGHVFFAVTDGGRCRRKHLKGERCNVQPRIRHEGI